MAEKEEITVGMEYHARLCRLLMDLGTKALRHVFNSIISPSRLMEELNKVTTKHVLQKLHNKSKISDVQWKLIYPNNGRRVSSAKFGFRFLVTMLKNICHLSSPYPNGWDGVPLEIDNSMAADIARLINAKDDLNSQYIMTVEEFVPYWENLAKVVTNILGTSCLDSVNHIRGEALALEKIQEYIGALKDSDKIEEKMDMKAHLVIKRQKIRKASMIPKEDREEKGITVEERTVLVKGQKVLVEKVNVDNLLDKLEFYKVINLEQRREIVNTRNNAENIAYLLSIVQGSKSSNAFVNLCEAVSAVYEDVGVELAAMQSELTQEAAAKGQNGVLIYIREVLYDKYTDRYSNVHPLPWLQNVTCSIEELYVPLNIADCHGQIVEPCEAIKAIKNEMSMPRILLQGDSGSGQTLTCDYVTYTWATKRRELHKFYDLVIYLDLQKPAETLADMVYDQLDLNKIGVEKRDLQTILDKYQSCVLYILDGYKHGNQNDEITRLLSGKLYPHSTVFLTSGITTKGPMHMKKCRLLCNFGFSVENAACCVDYYAHVAGYEENGTPSYVESILHNRDQLEIFKNPFMCMVTTAIGVTFGWERVADTKSDCDRLDLYLEIMLDQYCERQGLKNKHFRALPEEVLETLSVVQHHAFNSLLGLSKNVIRERLVDGSLLYRFGSFRKLKDSTNDGHRVMFICDVMRDFLAARYLAGQTDAEMNSKLERYVMYCMPPCERAMSFLCRLVQKYQKMREEEVSENLDDEDFEEYKPAMPDIKKLFALITKHNMRWSKSISFTGYKDENNCQTLGKFMDFSFGFKCLNQCHYDEELVTMTGREMPGIFQLGHLGIIPNATLQGFIQTIEHSSSKVSRIEISFSEINDFQIREIKKLGLAVAKNPHVTSLKVISHSLQILMHFLARCLYRNRTMRQIYLELTANVRYSISARVDTKLQATIRDACTNMANVEMLHVRMFKAEEIIVQIMRSIPETVKHLDLTGSYINAIAAREIGRMLRHNCGIQHLDLSNVRMDTTSLHVILQGVRLSHTLRVLNLSQTVFIPSTCQSLCETLRLNKSLTCLHLNRCSLTSYMALDLRSVLLERQTPISVYIIDAFLARDGRLALKAAKNNLVKVWPMSEKSGLSPVVGAE